MADILISASKKPYQSISLVNGITKEIHSCVNYTSATDLLPSETHQAITSRAQDFLWILVSHKFLVAHIYKLCYNIVLNIIH